VLQERDGPARFEREAKAINALKHVNIVGFYGYGVWHNQAPYMVMEFVEGTSLQTLLADGAVEPRRALSIMRQVFEALACAHAAGVVHRDLKPSNILINNGDQVKIIDFGLAKLMPGYGIPGQRLTETGYTLGTCHYMPPEQALGNQVDQRADIYSAGCIFYQMVTGKLPFDGENNIAIMLQHLNEEPAPIARFCPSSAVTTAIAAVVSNCIAKKPEERYQQVGEAIRDLDAVNRGDYNKVIPHVVSQKPAVKTVAKAKRQATVVLLGLCVAISGAIGFLYYQSASEQALYEENAAELWSRVGHSTFSDSESEKLAILAKVLDKDKGDHSLPPVQKIDLIGELFVSKGYINHHIPDAPALIQEALEARRKVSAADIMKYCEYYSDTRMVAVLRELFPADVKTRIAFLELGEQATRVAPNKVMGLAMEEAKDGRYEEAIRIASELQRDGSVGSYSYQQVKQELLGDVNCVIGNYKDARHHYQWILDQPTAIEGPLLTSDPPIRYRAYLGLERCARLLHDQAKAQRYAKEAKAFAKEHGCDPLDGRSHLEALNELDRARR
jgi:serine/threonine protein kinase